VEGGAAVEEVELKVVDERSQGKSEGERTRWMWDRQSDERGSGKKWIIAG